LSGLATNTTYHYRVISTDSAGNQALSVDFTFTTSVVATGPTVTGFAGVIEGQAVFGTVTIEALVDGVNVSKAVFELSGPNAATWTEKNAPYYFMGDTGGVAVGWDTTSYPDGTYTLTATATDGEGLTGSAQIRFTVANN
jgi:hypothetical protein